MAVAGIQSRNIVILGAGGYLGSSLCQFFYGIRDYEVTAVFRRQPNHRFFDNSVLADAFADDWAEKLPSSPPFALINCAFNFDAVTRANYQPKYMRFDRQLAALGERGALKLINISTMSAYPGCKTHYGREKLFIEALFNKYGGLNIRPGLIASWRMPGSAWLRLIDVTRTSKVIPLLSARNSGFYFCDLEAVLLGVFLLLGLHVNKAHTLSFCYRNRLSLTETVQLIERRYGISRLKLSIPWPVAYLLLRVKETLLGKSKIRADSVLDFAYPARSVQARQVFARLVDQYRGDLEALSRAEPAPRNLCFLEGRVPGPTSARPCRLKLAVGAEPLAALGRLTDP